MLAALAAARVAGRWAAGPQRGAKAGEARGPGTCLAAHARAVPAVGAPRGAEAAARPAR